jgi:hypothetical protein
MDELPEAPGDDDAQADALRRGRAAHYTAVRWWLRRLVRLMGVAPAVARARVLEQTEASAQARTESETVREWLILTARVAVDDEMAASPVDFDGHPFDPGELQWKAYLEQRGLDDDPDDLA